MTGDVASGGGRLPSLPRGWTWVPLRDLAAPEPRALTDGPFGSNLKTEHYTTSGPRVIRLQNIGEGVFLDAEAHISQERFEALRDHDARSGDVVLASLGERLPRACLVPEWLGPAIVKADCPPFRPHSSLDAAYLVMALNSEAVRSQAADVIHGIGRPRLKLAELKKLLIPLPPRAEQDRIVDVVTQQEVHVDAGEKLTRNALEELPVFRRSVLTAAVTGQLTTMSAANEDDAAEVLEAVLGRRHERWAHESMGRYADPTEPSPWADFELPPNWTWATVDQLAVGVQYGTSAKTTATDSDGVPVLRMGNIIDGGLDLSDLKYLPSDHPEFPALLLKDGDLLFNRTNSPELVGKSAIARKLPDPCSFASYLIRVRFAPEVEPEWVGLWLNSPYGRRWVAENVTQQVGQANVNGSKLRALTVPLPPAQAQRDICTAAGRLLAEAAALRTSLGVTLASAPMLRRGVWQAAATGELNTRDATDEPAELLAERIRADAAWRTEDSRRRGRSAVRSQSRSKS